MTSRPRFLGLVVVAAASLAIARSAAGQSSIHAEVDTTQVTVGDRITLTVTVDHPAGSQVTWPDSLGLAPFEVLDARTAVPEVRGDTLRSTAVITLAAFELGDLEIPSFDAEVVGPGGATDTLSTGSFTVQVVSVGADEGGDIRDIRGPLAIPLSMLRVSLWGLLALALVVGAWLAWRRMRGRTRGAAPPEPTVPPRPAHEVALEALARLEASPMLERGQVKEYHIEVSDILRTYVEARFDVAALEMTTGEVLDRLDRAGVDASFLEGLGRFLAPCDMVKFAKARPSAEASREVLALGRHLVEATVPQPVPAEPPAAAARGRVMFRFEDPLVLGLLALLPVVGWIRRRWEAGRSGTIRYSAVETVRASGEGRSRWLDRLPEVFQMIGLAAVVVALARPQRGIASESITTEGIDIVLALDVSTSMLAEDLQPNRLEAAKSVASSFLLGRRNDRIGLVAFAGEAFTQAPLTFDHGVVRMLVGELQTGMIQDGTAVGMGLATAVKRLQASDAASKVVILLTDGQSNRGEIGPLTAADMAKALGVKVYTIGAGTRGTAPVPVDDPLRGRTYVNVQVDVDEPTLQQVAAATGGRYFRATDNASLEQIYREIDQLERTEIEVENYTQYGELFGPALAAGLLLLLLESALSQTVLRRLP